MEDQLGALGLILNTITLWNTVYLDHAIGQLRATGYPVLDADIARLSPYMRRHINFHGHYSFAPTDGRRRRESVGMREERHWRWMRAKSPAAVSSSADGRPN